jgi:hypothetical protein
MKTLHLGGIENILIQHSDIEMTAVVAHKCSLTGELSTAAFVAPKCINLCKLREYLYRKMPQYMIPTYIRTVEKHEFPRTLNGKIDSKGLEEDESIHNHDQTFENSSLNERQRTVAMMWCRVFKYDEFFMQSLNRQSSFRELGGHSLHLVLLNRLIENEIKVKLLFTEIQFADMLQQKSDIVK